jgi:UDP-N-acetylglucosamine--N-acetylmuramyl-(pentapeptide) pyrophosphoryl-undecaprenol N-acetylglucosamine transferase
MTTATMNISSTDTPVVAGEPIRVLLAAGGTGGHVYPAIAIADAIKERSPDSEILFVGTRDRMEWQAVPKSGYVIKSVWISGFHRRLTPQNLLFPVKLITSIIQSYSILNSFKPDVVISCGGFAAGPVGWVAARKGIPIVIQEQNSYPGVTNKLLAKYASLIFTAFEDAAGYLPKEKISLTGNPVRKQLSKSDRSVSLDQFGFKKKKPVLLVLGGSGGALALNNAMMEHIEELHDSLGIQIIWQCGKKYYDDLKQKVEVEEFSGLRLVPYIENMPAAYSAADLVLTRAGASTCSELMLLGQPAILVPSPNVAGDHQSKNAQSMVDAGAAVGLNEKKLVEKLPDTVKQIIFDHEKLKMMSRAMSGLAKPDAASTIAKEIYTLVTSRDNE